MGNVGTRFSNTKTNATFVSKQSIMTPVVLQESNAGPVDYFSKPGAYVTHNATEPLSDIYGEKLIRLHAASSGGFIQLCSHTQ